MPTSRSQRVTFPGSSGGELAGRLELPNAKPVAYAIFAHCFTCSKDIIAARTISTALMAEGFAVLRFDFTGLGGSEGDFSSTNFTTNLHDLAIAADYLRTHYEAPQLLIGHSLGGAAVIVAAQEIPEVKAVATIGAPSSSAHITDKFKEQLTAIENEGAAKVALAGREFCIERHFIEALDTDTVKKAAHDMQAALLVMHAPLDNEVSIDHASTLFLAARHPKSYVTLDRADHLLTNKKDAAYAGQVISAWSRHYILPAEDADKDRGHHVSVLTEETGNSLYQVAISNGKHALLGDEPVSVGGSDTGPAPYEYVAAALGACTTITMRMYANRKGFNVDRIACRVTHEKQKPEGAESDIKPVDVFTRYISMDGNLDNAARTRMIEIANKCPVHRTLEHGATIHTQEEATS